MLALYGILFAFAALLAYFVYLAYKQPAPTEPLGIPRGSVRSMIAILMVVAAGLAIFSKVDSQPLWNLVSMVVGFYFGTRSAAKSSAAKGAAGKVTSAPSSAQEGNTLLFSHSGAHFTLRIFKTPKGYRLEVYVDG